MKPFDHTLRDIRGGALLEDLTASLAELLGAIQTTDKGGSLTLRLTIKPTKGLALEIEDDISLKKPELAKPSTLLFPTVDGNLQLQNPMQKSLDLTVVQHQQPGPLAQAPGADGAEGAKPLAQAAGT